MSLGSVFKKLAPWMATAVNFLPGAGPTIAGIITKVADTNQVKLPETIQPTVDSISNAVAALTGNSAAMLQLKQEDDNYALQMQAAGFKQLIDIEALQDADAVDARKRETVVRDKTPEFGFYLLITAFVGILLALFKWPVPTENKAVVFTMIGSLGTIVIGATQYFYGTTRSSGMKDDTIATIAKKP
jgi:hypothetical protein